MRSPAAINNAVELPITAIQPSKHPLRQYYDKEALRELGESITEIGGIYPVVVRPTSKAGTKFELIIGSRRLKSAQQRKEKTINAVILSSVDDKQSLVLALSENIKREGLTPFEEAAGFLTLLKDYKMSEKELAKRLSCDAGHIRRRLKLLSVPEKVQEMIAEKKLGIDRIETIAALPEKEQLKYAQTAVDHSLSGGELSLLAERDSVRKPVRQRRSHSERFTGKRTSLKVYAFAEWLKGSAPHILEMSRKDRRLVKEALDTLIASANAIAKNPAVGGQATDLAKALGKLNRTRAAS
jgi:ParB family chromosome partitioning protein